MYSSSFSSVKAIIAKPGMARGSHNIWELTLHSAYWKYAVRRRLEGSKRGSFVLKGSNFFVRPEKGKASESDWRSDQEILDTEHWAMIDTIRKILESPLSDKHRKMIYGVAFHDVYHAGQIRLLRRLQQH